MSRRNDYERQRQDMQCNTVHHVLYRLMEELTLRAGEGAVCRALGESTVEESVEGCVADIAELIVQPNELLEDLATVESNVVSKDVPSESSCLALRLWERTGDDVGGLLTRYRYVP